MGKTRELPAVRAIAGAVALAAGLAFFFVYPGHDPGPHDVPVAVVGPESMARTLAGADGGAAFAVRRYRSEQEARVAILDRDVYGAFVADGARVKLLTASSASPQVATLLEAVAAEAHVDSVVVDVRPLAAGDPRGASINLTTLATTIASIAGAVMLSLLAPELDGRRRLLALVAFAVLGGPR